MNRSENSNSDVAKKKLLYNLLLQLKIGRTLIFIAVAASGFWVDLVWINNNIYNADDLGTMLAGALPLTFPDHHCYLVGYSVAGLIVPGCVGGLLGVLLHKALDMVGKYRCPWWQMAASGVLGGSLPFILFLAFST